MSSAMVAESPSPAKLALIRRFLIATGTQAEIDNGSFLQRFALPGSLLSRVVAGRSEEITFRQSFDLSMKALMAAYEKHRHVWQEEYERHVNWEFDENELSLIVSFLESAAGQNFLEGRWRMDAYVSTNTEDLIEQIVADAETALGERAGNQ